MWSLLERQRFVISLAGNQIKHLDVANRLTKCNLFFLIFFQVRLYADMFLQVYFFVTSIYGWIVWHNKTTYNMIDVLSKNQRMKLLGISVLSTVIIGVIVKNIHFDIPFGFSKPASYPFL